jgi:hypothetical protein
MSKYCTVIVLCERTYPAAISVFLPWLQSSKRLVPGSCRKGAGRNWDRIQIRFDASGIGSKKYIIQTKTLNKIMFFVA